MGDEVGPRSGEKMRLCPTCRMEISVLATKCRYCGEEVGRPRDETRALSISDLGGETVQHYAPSSSVMEALEAFRSEEDSEPAVEAEAAPSGMLSRFTKKQEPAKPQKSETDGLPELDERSQALASLAMPSAREKFQPSVVHNQRSIPRMAGIFAGLVAAMVCAYFGVQILAKRPTENLGPTVENPAILMLERGDDPLEALRASLETEAMDPHPSHEKVSFEARKLCLAKVENLLNTDPWRSSDLDKASAEISRIIKVDRDNQDLKRIQEEIRAERRAYDMYLQNIDSSGNKATFSHKIGGGESEVVEAALGGRVLERFEVVEIRADRVRMIDHKRNGRSLTWHSNGEISSP